ncbi:unnamed protein product [Onchocerca flexuosa]|uniref:Myosin motor domain-containing protein n=1 Tax=Onchocerca flexuosa TaxID=387005 RepID=A0A183HPM6_9BILA|nr:unnamed protein product [Onchocerca flexuosa]
MGSSIKISKKKGEKKDRFLYSLLTGLASWGLSDTTANGDSSHYINCNLEALGKVRPGKR